MYTTKAQFSPRQNSTPYLRRKLNTWLLNPCCYTFWTFHNRNKWTFLLALHFSIYGEFRFPCFIKKFLWWASSLIQTISKYQTRPLYNLCEIEEVLGIKERIRFSSVKNSSNNSDPNLFKKMRTVLLCFRAKVLTQESRSIYFSRYKLFVEDPL